MVVKKKRKVSKGSRVKKSAVSINQTKHPSVDMAENQQSSTVPKKMIKPYIAKLKKSKLSDSQKNTLDLVGQNLDAIASPFLYDQLSLFIKLTAKEIQISNLIKQGLSTKEIASALDLSVRTVETHRYQIRKKMGLKDKKLKLRDKLLKTY